MMIRFVFAISIMYVLNLISKTYENNDHLIHSSKIITSKFLADRHAACFVCEEGRLESACIYHL